MKLSFALPEPLIAAIEFFESGPDGQSGNRVVRTYGIMPASRDQVKRALALDPDADVVDAVKLEGIRAEQARIFTEQSGLVKCEEPLELDLTQRIPCEKLAGEQCAQIGRAVLHHHLGQDPAQAEAIHQLKKNALLLERYLRASIATSNGAGAASPSTETPANSPPISTPPPATPGESGT